MADNDGTTEGGASPADPPGGGGTEGGGGTPPTMDALAGLKQKLGALLGDEGKTSEVLRKAAADGLKDTAGAAVLTAEDWIVYGVPKVPARQLVAELTKAAIPAAEPRGAATGGPVTMAAMLLPTVPDDTAFLTMLQVGGVLRPEPTDVMAAIRAAFASQLDAFDLDDRLLEAIEARAIENDEPVPPIFFDLEKAKTRKAHADVLRALGVPGAFVTDRRKKEFLGRLAGLWDALSGFHMQVDAWKRTWLEQAANPAMLMQALTAAAGGVGLPGLMEAPDTGPVIDAASGVIDRINRMFAGTGVPVARALAADAIQLKQLLERPEIVSAVGAASREEMLKRLSIGVSADVVRTERTVVQFALATLELSRVPQPNLPMYITALAQLGAVIPWNQLKAGIGGNGIHGKVRIGPAKRAGAEADDQSRGRVF